MCDFSVAAGPSEVGSVISLGGPFLAVETPATSGSSASEARTRGRVASFARRAMCISLCASVTSWAVVTGKGSPFLVHSMSRSRATKGVKTQCAVGLSGYFFTQGVLKRWEGLPKQGKFFIARRASTKYPVPSFLGVACSERGDSLQSDCRQLLAICIAGIRHQ